MEISLQLHYGQVALTLCLFSGAEEDGESSFPQLYSTETFLQAWSKETVPQQEALNTSGQAR